MHTLGSAHASVLGAAHMLGSDGAMQRHQRVSMYGSSGGGPACMVAAAADQHVSSAYDFWAILVRGIDNTALPARSYWPNHHPLADGVGQGLQPRCTAAAGSE